MTIEKRNSRRFILLFMGMLSAFGPFVTDFYLPTLPQLTNDFETTTSLVQLTLTFSMIGLAVGQMIIGPLSDKYGRRTPLILSLALFIVSTVACLYARGYTLLSYLSVYTRICRSRRIGYIPVYCNRFVFGELIG